MGPLPPASLSEQGENDFQKWGRKTADITHLPSSLTSEKRGNSFFRKMGKYYLLFTPVYRWDFGKYQAKLSDIEKNLSVREYHSKILDYSKNHLSPFINIKYHAGHLYASIVFDGQIYPYSLIYDLETGESLLFGKTKEGMWFLPELFVDGIMYKFVDYEFLPDYVNREILDPSSQLEYDKVLMQRGAAVIKYYS